MKAGRGTVYNNHGVHRELRTTGRKVNGHKYRVERNGTEGDGCGQFQDLALLHGRYDLKGRVLTPLLEDSLENLQYAYGGYNEALCIFNSWSEKIGIRSIGKVLELGR